MAKKNSPGCHCCTSSVCTVVTVCGAYASGATVTINRHSDGLFIGSCTTSGTGQCCISVPCTEIYDITASYSTCTDVTVTRTVTCSGAFAVAIEVGPPAGSNCLPGCACSSIPSTVSLSATGPCDDVFHACSLVYGPTPSSLSGINLGANCFLSTATFVDSLSGLSYRYNFGCDTIFFRLSRVYLPTSTSGAFHDSSIYSWSIGQPGNTCSPFLLSSGYIYPGGNTTCIVSVS